MLALSNRFFCVQSVDCSSN